MVNDPETARFLPSFPPATFDGFQRVLERRRMLEAERGFAMWAVDLKEIGAFIGQCGFFPVEGKGPEIELAYHYARSFWNKGYGSEAARAALRYAFETIGLDRAIALVMAGNLGSQRVAEKAGMRLDGVGTYYEIPDMRRYVAERDWWTAYDSRES